MSLLSLAACSEGGAGELTGEAAARGREERAFWACYDRARAAQAAGDVEAARSAYAEALRHKPGHGASLYALAGIEHRAGRHVEALELARRLAEVDRPPTRAYLLRAAIRSDVEAVLASGAAPGPWFDLADADVAARAAEDSNPEETGPHLARAKVALLRDDREVADASLRRVLTIHPGHAEALVLRAVLAERTADEAGARGWVAKALAATTPRTPVHPPGEGDTKESLAAATSKLETSRLRALAAALRFGFEPWPADAPPRPIVRPMPRAAPAAVLPPRADGAPERRAGAAFAPAAASVAASGRLEADFDGDGAADELVARRAPERDALLSLFGVRDAARGSFTLRLAGRDATGGSGLEGVAACVASLAVLDAEGDGDPDVLVLPGAGDPSRVEPPLLLLNQGGGRFEIAVTQ